MYYKLSNHLSVVIGIAAAEKYSALVHKAFIARQALSMSMVY